MNAGLRYLSLFSGMEAAAVALEPLGWMCVGVAEVDRDACAVLAHRNGATAPRYLPPVPDDWAGPGAHPFDPKRYAQIRWGDRIPNLGDVSQVTDADLAALGRIDVVIGGSPCQDLSVAGLRRGLGGARSSLFHQQLRIFNAARTICGARWLWWENVLGAFSSNTGRDFAAVVGTMAGTEFIPPDRWGNEGVALGPRGLVEWGVLDAQWFGVAQRRRRVFAVLDIGSWADRPPILLEPESLRGDTAPRREPGQGAAGTLTARAGSGSPGIRAECDGGAGIVVMASGQAGAEISTDGSAPTLTCLHEAPIVASCRPQPYQDVSSTLCAADAKGANGNAAAVGNLIPVIAGTLDRNHSVKGQDAWTGKLIVFDCKAAGDTALAIGEVPGTLRASHGGGHAAVFGPCIQVRRLTPRECERLQGVPDDHTLVPIGRNLMADGPRYKLCGNSFAAPCIRWIGQRIQRAHYWPAAGGDA